MVLPAIEHHGPIEAWIDDTGVPNKGTHAVGVTRQYIVGKLVSRRTAKSRCLCHLPITMRACQRPIASTCRRIGRQTPNGEARRACQRRLCSRRCTRPIKQTRRRFFLTQSYYEGQSFVLQTGNFSTHHPSRHWRRSRDRRRRAERHHRRPRWVTTRDTRTSPACDCDILRAATCTAMPLILAYGASQGYDKSEWRPIGGCSLQLEC
jgi:hypothetical protein